MSLSLKAWFHPPWDVSHFAPYFAFMGTGFLAQDSCRRYCFARGRVRLPIVLDLLSYLGQLLALVGFHYFGGLSVELVLLIAGTTSFLGVIPFIFSAGPVQFGRASFIYTLRRNWKFSSWLLGGIFFQWCTANLYLFFAGAVLGAPAVGGMKAAQNIIGPTHILMKGLDNIIPAKASKAFNTGGYLALTDYLRSIAAMAGGIVVLISLLVGLLAQEWFSLFYGSHLQEYSYLLKWFAFLYPLSFITFIFRVTLRSVEYTKGILVAYLSSSCLTLGLAWWIVPTLGLDGVMLGMILSAVALIGVMGYMISSRFRAVAGNIGK